MIMSADPRSAFLICKALRIKETLDSGHMVGYFVICAGDFGSVCVFYSIMSDQLNKPCRGFPSFVLLFLSIMKADGKKGKKRKGITQHLCVSDTFSPPENSIFHG